MFACRRGCYTAPTAQTLSIIERAMKKTRGKRKAVNILLCAWLAMYSLLHHSSNEILTIKKAASRFLSSSRRSPQAAFHARKNLWRPLAASYKPPAATYKFFRRTLSSKNPAVCSFQILARGFPIFSSPRRSVNSIALLNIFVKHISGKGLALRQKRPYMAIFVLLPPDVFCFSSRKRSRRKFWTESLRSFLCGMGEIKRNRSRIISSTSLGNFRDPGSRFLLLQK